MELKFVGRGSALNPKEGNTAAYYIEGRKMLLFDCGETTYENLISLGVLEDIDEIYAMITHPHPDHIGSFGTLIFHFFFSPKPNLNFVFSSSDFESHTKPMYDLLKLMGVRDYQYNMVSDTELSNRFDKIDLAYYSPTSHYEGINSYSIILKTEDGILYYSGDTNEIETVKGLIGSDEKIDKIYIDTTSMEYEGNVHMPIRLIGETIPQHLKDQVYCMHLDGEETIEKAKRLGFRIVKKERK